MNQHQKIIDYLEKNKDITSFTAYTILHITQLATRIKELEKQGYEFNKVWDYNINKEGNKSTFKRYSLVREDTNVS